MKSRADLSQRWLQVVVLAVMIVAGTAVLTASFAVTRSTSLVFDEVHESAHGPHVWISGEESSVRAIGDHPGVSASSSAYQSLADAGLIFRGELHEAEIMGSDGTAGVAPGVLREGRWVAPGADGEVVIDRGLASGAGIAIGDRVLLVGPDAVASSLEVVGIITPVIRVPYPQLTPAAVFVSTGAVDALAGDADTLPTSLGLRLESPDEAEAFAAQLPQELHAVTWQDVRADVLNQTMGPSGTLRIIAIFAVLALSFVVAATIGNHAAAQQREIGLLKAVGVTPRQTTMMLLGQMLAISIPSAMVGVLIGIAATPLFQRTIVDLLDHSAVLSFSIPVVLVTIVAVQALVVVCAALPAIRAGRIRIADAIAPGRRSSARRRSRFARIANAFRLSPVLVLGAKDVFSRPWRSWLTLAAIAVAVAMLMMTFTLRHSLNEIVDEPALLGSAPFELEAVLLDELEPVPGSDDGVPPGGLPYEDAAALVADHPSVETVLAVHTSESTVSDINVLAHAVSGDLAAMPFLYLDGRPPASPGEVMIGAGIARTLELSVGDELEVMVLPGQPQTMRISAIYFIDENDGNALMYPFEALHALDPQALPGMFNIRLHDDADIEAVIEDLAERSNGSIATTDLTRESDANISDAQGLITPMTLLAAGLALLAAGNLLSSLVFSIRERTREFGVMKSIGITPRQIVAIVVVGVAPLALLGTLIGAPVGYFLLDQLFRGLAEAHQPADIVQVPPAGWLVLLVVIALGITALGSLLPARRASEVSVAEALRAE